MINDLIFHSISLRNFKSYGNVLQTVNLNTPSTTTVITAENLDLGSGGSNNGSGKTSIMDALCFCLYDKVMQDTTKDALINNLNKKDMEVMCTFQKVNTSEFIKVHRGRKMKSQGGNFVKIFVGDTIDLTDKDEVTQSGAANDMIEKLLGMPFEIFVRVVVYSATTEPFLHMPVRSTSQASQQSFVEFVLHLTILSQYVDELKERVKVEDQALKTNTALAEQSKRQAERHHQMVYSALADASRWQTKIIQDAESIAEQMEQLSAVDFEAQRSKLVEHQEYNVALQEVNSTLASLQKDLQQIQKDHATVNGQVKHLAQDMCPFCKRDYKDPAMLAELQKVMDELTAKQSDVNTTIREHTEVMVHLRDQIKLCSAEIIVRPPTLEGIHKMEQKTAVLQQQLISLEQQTNPHEEVAKRLQGSSPEVFDTSCIDNNTKTIEHLKFLTRLLNDKDSFVRRRLLEEHLPFLNNRLQGYINDLGLPHTVKFNQQLEVEISQFGNPIDYGLLSNGQQSRCNVAMSLAFRDILQKLHGRVNLCILDEALDVGLDTVGVDKAIKLIKKKAREEKSGFFVISHRSEIEGVMDAKIVVRMERGFSHIHQE